MIGDDPATDEGVVKTAVSAGDLWPHQARAWQSYTTSGWWESEPQLTVKGNIDINILCLYTYFIMLSC